MVFMSHKTVTVKGITRSWWLNVYVNSVLGWLHCATVGNVIDISDVYATSISGVKVCGVSMFPCIYRFRF
jgi:hypothetical protein